MMTQRREDNGEYTITAVHGTHTERRTFSLTRAGEYNSARFVEAQRDTRNKKPTLKKGKPYNRARHHDMANVIA